MKKRIGMLVCLLAVLLCACAAADVKIDETHFPDKAFRDYVTRFDKDGSGVLTEAELNSVDEIDLSRPTDYVYSIQGVEYFPVLHKLDFGGALMSSVDLTKNKQLSELNCNYCVNLANLDLSQNWALKSLNCDQCPFSSLDLSANPALETLSCDECNLTALDLKDHASLKTLNCDANQLTTLNLEGCTALTDVVCSRNYLTGLDLRNNTNLKSVDCDANNLTSLKVPATLEKLVCSRNSFGTLDLSGLWGLQEVDCFNCQLTSLKLDGCTEMSNLACSENQLTSLDLSSCSFLKVLDISSNKLTDLDLSDCFVLSGLMCWDNQIGELDISWCLNLSEAYLKGTKDEPLRFVERYSYHGSWLSIDEGQKVKAAGDSETEPASISGAVIAVKDQVYTGKALRPKLKVTVDGKKLKADTDYTVTYKNNRKIGIAKVTVKGIGRYTGKATAYFTIRPAKVTLSAPAAGKESLTVKWTGGSGTDGFEVEYGLKKDFSDGTVVTVRKADAAKYRIRGLKPGKTYYVRVRTFKVADGTTYYSAWSKKKSGKAGL